MNPVLWTLLLSVLPFSELRGAIPFAIASKMPAVPVLISCVALNICIIPLILSVLDVFFKHLVFRLPRIGKRIEKQMHHAAKKLRPYVKKYGVIGLALFVGIPLPFTGAYTGCLAAYLLGFDRKHAVGSIAIGVIVAGILVTLASVGVINLFW